MIVKSFGILGSILFFSLCFAQEQQGVEDNWVDKEGLNDVKESLAKINRAHGKNIDAVIKLLIEKKYDESFKKITSLCEYAADKTMEQACSMLREEYDYSYENEIIRTIDVTLREKDFIATKNEIYKLCHEYKKSEPSKKMTAFSGALSLFSKSKKKNDIQKICQELNLKLNTLMSDNNFDEKQWDSFYIEINKITNINEDRLAFSHYQKLIETNKAKFNSLGIFKKLETSLVSSAEHWKRFDEEESKRQAELEQERIRLAREQILESKRKESENARVAALRIKENTPSCIKARLLFGVCQAMEEQFRAADIRDTVIKSGRATKRDVYELQAVVSRASDRIIEKFSEYKKKVGVEEINFDKECRVSMRGSVNEVNPAYVPASRIKELKEDEKRECSL